MHIFLCIYILVIALCGKRLGIFLLSTELQEGPGKQEEEGKGGMYKACLSCL